MFTGIIEEIGKVKTLARGSKSIRLEIEARKVIEGTYIGDSIATDGVCLTVTDMGADWFAADVMPETVNRTALRELSKGSAVNLERALTPTSRMGGHMVMGHVDAIGHIVSKRQDDIAIWLTIETEHKVLKYMVAKGSVAIDGVSLTVVDTADHSFRVSIIPHTQSQTTLTDKRVGDVLNLESDILARYVEKLTSPNREGITMDYLMKNGF